MPWNIHRLLVLRWAAHVAKLVPIPDIRPVLAERDPVDGVTSTKFHSHKAEVYAPPSRGTWPRWTTQDNTN